MGGVSSGGSVLWGPLWKYFSLTDQLSLGLWSHCFLLDWVWGLREFPYTGWWICFSIGKGGVMPVGTQGLHGLWQDPLPGLAWGELVSHCWGDTGSLLASRPFPHTFERSKCASIRPMAQRRFPRSSYVLWLHQLLRSAWSITGTLNLSCSGFVGFQIYSSLNFVEPDLMLPGELEIEMG